MSNVARMTHPLILLYSDWPKNKIVIDYPSNQGEQKDISNIKAFIEKVHLFKYNIF